MNRKAFTLVELLVVIMIIGMLMGILIPAVFSALEQANRASCANNLSQIGKACQTYSSSHKQRWPDVFASDSASWDLVGNTRDDHANPPNLRLTAAAPGDIPANKVESNTANFWMLIASMGLTPDVFVCPSQDMHEADKAVADYNSVRDFANELYVSYSYQNVFGAGSLTSTSGRATNFAVAADANPQRRDFFKVTTGTPVLTDDGQTDIAIGKYRFVGDEEFIQDWNTDLVGGFIDKAYELNSPNHGFEGQNVLYLDGHVEWKTYPWVGPNWDNIWLARDTTATATIKTDDLSTIRDYDKIDSYDGASEAAVSNDSFLVP
jgi:prepilin-type N-terminal cleavage/methylation domain-containing protein/prepilin-type processing-associated H-X9-DG protein